MGSIGLHVGDTNLVPITGTLDANELRLLNEAKQSYANGNKEFGLLYSKDGEPIVGYQGDRHSVAIDDRVLNSDGIFSHLHPSDEFGGTLSMTDLKVFAKSNLSELRAFSKQGQLYSVKETPNSDKAGLLKWVNSHQKIFQKNFESMYDKALDAATTPLKSGPHAGEVRIPSGVEKKTYTDKNGKERTKTVTKYTYRKPMTAREADVYARQYSVGTFDRAYQNALKKYGFNYTSTKAGKRLK